MITSRNTGSKQLELFQLFELLILTDIDLPPNFLNFVRMFGSNCFEIIPNPIKIDESNLGINLHPLLIDEEFACLILNNAGNLIIEILALIAFKGILIVFNSNKFVKKIDNFFNLGLIVNFLFAIQIDIIMAVVVNLRNLFIGEFISFSNGFLSLVLLGIYLYLNYKHLEKSIDLEKIKKKFGKYDHEKAKPELKKWIFLKEGLKEKLKGVKYLLPSFLLLKDFLITTAVLSLIEYPVIQILAALTIYTCSLIMNWTWKPYKEKRVNLINIIDDIFFVLIYLTYLIIAIFETKLGDGKRIVGIFMIIGTCGTVLMNFIVGIIDMYYGFKEWKNERKRKKEIVSKEAGKDREARPRDLENILNDNQDIRIQNNIIQGSRQGQNREGLPLPNNRRKKKRGNEGKKKR